VTAPSTKVSLAFETRAKRAETLAPHSVPAGEVLRFAAGLYRAQGQMAAALAEGATLSGRFGEDAPRILPLTLVVAAFVEAAAPDALREVARARLAEDQGTVLGRLRQFWEDGDAQYLHRAMLRPYVEVLSGAHRPPDRPHREGRCPFCGGGPWISARRQEPDSDAARRLLGCSLCGGEWSFPRVRCPCCAEENPEKLPVFQNETHPAARIDACETCRRYVKSIDLTQDARPIPEVDDLVSLSLDLWAVEEGFSRLEPGLAGL
jgi:formate dehydrogenase accessory protein FdhE